MWIGCLLFCYLSTEHTFLKLYFPTT
jgi:hypothetical protein